MEYLKAYCARVHVNGIQRTKEDYLRQQITSVFTSNTFESLLINVEQLRSKLLQMGCFRDVTVLIDKAQGFNDQTNTICFLFKILCSVYLDCKVENSYDITYVTQEHRPLSGGLNTAVGQNEGSLVSKLKHSNLSSE